MGETRLVFRAVFTCLRIFARTRVFCARVRQQRRWRERKRWEKKEKRRIRGPRARNC